MESVCSGLYQLRLDRVIWRLDHVSGPKEPSVFTQHEDGFSIWEMYEEQFSGGFGASSGCAGQREAQPLGPKLGEERSVAASVSFLLHRHLRQ